MTLQQLTKSIVELMGCLGIAAELADNGGALFMPSLFGQVLQ